MDYIQVTWDWRLIALSYLIAVCASYAWLSLAGRVTAVKGRALAAWMLGGAAVLGCGIWATNFTGMLALDLGMPVTYSVPMLSLSFVAPALAVLLALTIIRAGGLGAASLLLGGPVIGLGIAATYYFGMTSMRMAAEVTYEPFLSGLATFIAVGASISSLSLASRFAWKRTGERTRLFKFAGAVVMGLAIAGMHYTAMAADRFTSAGEPPDLGSGALDLGSGALGFAIGAVVLLVLEFTTLFATVDERLLNQNMVLQRSEQGYRSLFDHNPDGVYSLDLKGNFLSVNPAWEEMTGYSREELIQTSCTSLVATEHREKRLEEFEAVAGGESRSVRIAIHRKDGSRLELGVNLVPMMVHGEVEGVHAVAKDITRRLSVEEELKESEQRFRQLFEGSVDGIIVHNVEGEVVDCNSQAADSLGYTREELLSLNVADIEMGLLPEEDLAEREEGTLWQKLAASEPGKVLGRHYGRHRRKDGSIYPVEVLVGSVVYGGEKMILASHRDVTEQRRTEEALRESEKRFRAIFDGAAVGISIADTERRLQETNAAYQRLTESTEEELYGKPIAELSHPADVAEDEELNRQLLAGEIERYQREKRYVRKDGEVMWIRPTISAARNEDGEPWFLVGMVEDITDRKLLEEELTYRAYHDELTGLPNRALFSTRLEQALEGSSGSPGSVGVLFMDLDNFKVVNDSLGHECGDLLLKEVADRLGESVRDHDTVARLSGDEFTIILERLSGIDEALRVADRILLRLQEPFELSGHTVAASVSIGVSIHTDREDTAGLLMRNADLAMYEAKRQGKSGYKVFDSTMEEKAQNRIQLESELRRAVEEEEFTLRYQPKFTTQNEELAGVEALVRWEHPERGLIYPDNFIPLAEETGIIVRIGQWVLEEACSRVAGWPAPADGNPVPVAVNVSAKQFQQPDFPETVALALRKSGLEPGRLALEITESLLLGDSPLIQENLHRLKRSGVTFVIDDFGTGYSSLSYLRRFPVDYLKVDRSFIEGLGESSQEAGVVSAIVNVAHALGIKVTAEGVETAEQLARLGEMGCDMCQGYYWERPVEETRIVERIHHTRESGNRNASRNDDDNVENIFKSRRGLG